LERWEQLETRVNQVPEAQLDPLEPPESLELQESREQLVQPERLVCPGIVANKVRRVTPV